MLNIGELDVKTHNAEVSRKKKTDIRTFEQKLVEYERNKVWVRGAGIYFDKIKIKEV